MRNGWIRRLPVPVVAEWLTRLAMSWHVAPGVAEDAHDPVVIRRLVLRFVWPALKPRKSTRESRAQADSPHKGPN
jgi:hypothetical protein